MAKKKKKRPNQRRGKKETSPVAKPGTSSGENSTRDGGSLADTQEDLSATSPSSDSPAIPETVFRDFIQFIMGPQKRETQIILMMFGIVAAFFCFCYPHPFLIEDSIGYIKTATFRTSFFYRPLGYAIFLDLFHMVASSYVVVFFVQFALTCFSSLFFLLTVKFFFPPKTKLVSILFSVFLVFSPSVLYLNIWILADSLYISSTMLWLALGIWVLKTGMKRIVIPFVVLFLVLSQLRYIGIVLSSVPLICLAFRRSRLMLVTVVLMIAISCGVYWGSKRYVESKYGVDTISVLSGRAQLCGVGLMFPHLDEEFRSENTFPGGEIRQVHRGMGYFFRENPRCFEPKSFFQSNTPTGGGPTFVWDYNCPPAGISRGVQKRDKTWPPYSELFSSAAYSHYAGVVVKKYPFEYVRYYLLPNLQRVFLPEFLLEGFEFKGWKVPPEAATWFDVSIEKFEARWDFYYDYLRPISAPINCLLWVITCLTLVAMALFYKRLQFDRIQKLGLLSLVSYIFVYVGFSLIAHPVLFRYLVPLHGAQIAVIYVVLNALVSKER